MDLEGALKYKDLIEEELSLIRLRRDKEYTKVYALFSGGQEIVPNRTLSLPPEIIESIFNYIETRIKEIDEEIGRM